MSSKECKHPTCSGETCRREKTVKQSYRLKRTPIKRRFSKKRQRLNTKYSAKSKQFREDNPLCVIHSSDCIRVTQGVHHVKGKATHDLLMDENHWLPCCNPCNLYIETHSEWAKKKGFKKLNTNTDET